VDALSLLADSALFYGTPRERLEPLAAAAARRSYARGAYLFHEGDPGRHLFLILSGEVKIARVGHGGGEAVFTVLLPGDVFGELALFDDEGLRTSDAQAIVATECLTVDRGVLMDFLVRQPETMRRLIGLLGRHIRRKDDAFSEVSFLDISGRVAHKLLDLAATHGEPAPAGTRIRLRLSQRTLAGMVAASRENVNRALSHFVADGAIRQDGGYITILDSAKLRHRAGAM